MDISPAVSDVLDEVISIENAVHIHPWSRQQIKSSLIDYLSWVIRKEDRMAGYLFVMPIVDDWELLNIAIDGDFQRQGLARIALKFLKERAFAAGVQRILLEVRESNAQAIKLYQSSGFVQDGRRKNYYPAENHREDAILMSCRLK